ncbi:hypothetical protein GGX14DRAFT_665225 [Mycena pura]|uniref:Uncharacterized protein n=1 Tax=Mycena pura TaxID=153505 RepID=A0AAD6Y4G3_9AGAR|nr:hypothetical protein GGX14DRAFT_665225 [Mycena pura]
MVNASHHVIADQYLSEEADKPEAELARIEERLENEPEIRETVSGRMLIGNLLNPVNRAPFPEIRPTGFEYARQKQNAGDGPLCPTYNPLSVHTTVHWSYPEINDSIAGSMTLALSGGRTKISASGLGRQERPAPFQLKLPRVDEETGVHLIGLSLSRCRTSRRCWRRVGSMNIISAIQTANGCQLERALAGTGIASSGLGSSSSRRSSPSSSSNSRVLRRRLDIAPDGAMYHLDANGTRTRIPFVDEAFNDSHGDRQDLGVMRVTFMSSAQDYVARTRYLVGTQPDSNSESTVEARRAIAKLTVPALILYKTGAAPRISLTPIRPFSGPSYSAIVGKSFLDPHAAMNMFVPTCGEEVDIVTEPLAARYTSALNYSQLLAP